MDGSARKLENMEPAHDLVPDVEFFAALLGPGASKQGENHSDHHRERKVLERRPALAQREDTQWG